MDDSNLRLRTSKSQSGSTLLESDEDLLSSKNRVCILSLLDKVKYACHRFKTGSIGKSNVNPNSYIHKSSKYQAFPKIFSEKAMISKTNLVKRADKMILWMFF